MRFNFSRSRHIILYGLSMAIFLILIRWLSIRLVIINYAFEVYVGTIAVIFTAFGSWLALKLARPRVKTVVVEKQNAVFRQDEEAIGRLGISGRELEVLHLMAEGLSNAEIAGRLYISLDTVKSHSKNLFSKLGVQRRTQAIDKSRKLNIIP